MKKLLIAIILVAPFFVAHHAHAAIAFDASSTAAIITSGSSIGWSHTITSSGANTYLIVGVGAKKTSSDPTVSSVVYGGVSMTQVTSTCITSSITHICSSVWVLFNPPTGTNNATATYSTTVNGGWAAGVSYTGVNQSNTVDATQTGSGTTSGSQTVTITTNTDNSWVYSFAEIAWQSGTSGSITPSQTDRGNSGASNVASTGDQQDTNSVVHPAGSQAMAFTFGGSGTFGWNIIDVSLAPAAGGGGGSAPPPVMSFTWLNDD